MLGLGLALLLLLLPCPSASLGRPSVSVSVSSALCSIGAFNLVPPAPVSPVQHALRLVHRAVFASALSMQLLAPSNVQASEWTDRQRLAAETWRTVDDLFYDRSFNGQDWFQLRQSIVKKGYNSDEELYTSLKTMLEKLGDKYTRFLRPAQYTALLSSSTGELVGLGIELQQRPGEVVLHPQYLYITE
jgi:hypothetical protein